MTTAKRFQPGFFTWLMVIVVVLSAFNAPGAINGDPARFLPADTFLYLIIPEGLTALQEKLKRTSMWELYKDPAMQRFIEPTEKDLRQRIDEELKEAWKELSMDQPPQELPWPTGRVVFAMRMGAKTSQEKKPPKQFVLIAEMGKNMATLKEIAEKAAEKAVEAGAKRLREDIRGVQMETITPAPPESDDGQSDHHHNHSSSHEQLSYAFPEQTALVSNDPDMLRDVLARMGGAQLDSLADNSQMNEILQGLDGPGDLIAYFNVTSLINSMTDAAPADGKAKFQKLITALGLDNVEGLGLKVQITPSRVEELRLRASLVVNGQKRGLVALLTPISTSTSGHRLLSKGLASFMIANYDPETIFNRINQIMQAIGKPDINIILAQIMTVTAMNDPAGRPAVDLQKEIIAQLDSPLTILRVVHKPYPDLEATTLVALGVRDAAILETALARVHETLLAPGRKEFQQEFLGTKIFLLPIPRWFTGQSESDDQHRLPFAVAGDNFVIGDAEQAIRDLRRDDLQPIQSDPFYSQAARYLPAQSGAWYYENHQITTESNWNKLKAAPRNQLAQKNDERPRQLYIAFGFGMPTPVADMIKQFERLGNFSFDFSALPDFELVKKHFGASIWHLKETQQGLYFESLLIKAE